MPNAQVQNDPVYVLPLLNIYGLNMVYAAVDTVNITAGQCRDSNDIMDIVLGSPPLNGGATAAPLAVKTTFVGAGGLDKGTLLDNTMYKICMIADSRYLKPVSAVFSLEPDVVSLPYGYDSFRTIGYMVTDSGGNIEQFFSYGLGNNRFMQYADPRVALTAGAATTDTLLLLTNLIPASSNQKVTFYTVFHPVAIGNQAVFLPYGGLTDFQKLTAVSVNAQDQQFQMMPNVISSSPAILYRVTAGNVDLSVQGYDFTI